MRARTIGALLSGAFILAGAVPTVALGGARSASSHTVTLKNTAFHPGNLTIKKGESVTWVWRDGKTKHNVTGKGFHSKTQASGSYTVRFSHSGTFNYVCTIHQEEGMKGKVVVH